MHALKHLGSIEAVSVRSWLCFFQQAARHCTTTEQHDHKSSSWAKALEPTYSTLSRESEHEGCNAGPFSPAGKKAHHQRPPTQTSHNVIDWSLRSWGDQRGPNDGSLPLASRFQRGAWRCPSCRALGDDLSSLTTEYPIALWHRPGIAGVVARSLSRTNILGSRHLSTASMPPRQEAKRAKHSVALWGNADFGRLGHGNHKATEEPAICEALEEYSIKQVACGGAHSIVLTGASFSHELSCTLFPMFSSPVLHSFFLH